MAPPPLPTRQYGPTITSRQVTEDTPPDLLEGTMDLQVTLPSGKTMIMNVHRSTPMMDLLVQVTTAHRINPGGHIIQVVSDNIFLSYKPSTPIGQLDTSAIKIVPKNKLKDAVKSRKSSLQQQAVERNIRLKVNLPRNQLAVYRVPPRTLISDILSMVCKDKNLDEEGFEIRHPVNVDERLRGSCSLSDYQLQEVCVVSRDFRPPPLSVTDLITMASIAHPDDKKRRGFLGGIFSRKAKSSTGDSSVSSGSAGERSVSPARSDESGDGRPAPRALSPATSSATLTNNTRSRNNAANSAVRMSRPVSMISLSKAKKGPAPVPPMRKSVSDVNGKIHSSKETKINLSRHSSDSSGYHEPEAKSSYTSQTNSEIDNFNASRTSQQYSQTNLTQVSSNSMSSVASSKCKRRAPPPPKMLSKKPPLAIPEEDVDSSQNVSDMSMSSSGVPKNDLKSAKEMSECPESSMETSHISDKGSAKVTLESNNEGLTKISGETADGSNMETSSLINEDLFVECKSSSLDATADACARSVTDSQTSSETILGSEVLELNKDNCIETTSNISNENISGIGSQTDNQGSLEPSECESSETTKDSCTEAFQIIAEKSPNKNLMSSSLPKSEISNSEDVKMASLDLANHDTSAFTPKVEHNDLPSNDVKSNSKQPSCSILDIEVQAQKLSLSSETSHEYVELLNDLQRPKRQKKHRSKIPDDFVDISAKDPIYKSVEEETPNITNNFESSSNDVADKLVSAGVRSNSTGPNLTPLKNDRLLTDCKMPSCGIPGYELSQTESRSFDDDHFSSENYRFSIKDDKSLIGSAETKLNELNSNAPSSVSNLTDDSLNSQSHKNSERVSHEGTDTDDDENAFDVNGIIKVAEQSFDSAVVHKQSEDVPDFIQRNTANGISSDMDNEYITEAINTDVRERLQPEDDGHVKDGTKRGLFVEIPAQEESSTDPSYDTLEQMKPYYTSKVELSSENDHRLGLVKKPCQRSVSITRISGDPMSTSEKHQSKEELVKHDVISELKSNISISPLSYTPKILTLKPKSNSASNSEYNVVLSYNNSNQPKSMVDKSDERTESDSSYESVNSVYLAQSKVDIPVRSDRSSTETSYESAPPPLPESCVPISSDSESKESRSSSVSRQSSLSDSDKRQFAKPQRPSGPPAPVFSISTYTSRAETISYDKKLVRSESLTSFCDIPSESFTKVFEESNLDKEKDDFVLRKLGRTDSRKNDMYRSEEFLNKKLTLNTVIPAPTKNPVHKFTYETSRSGTNSPTNFKTQSLERPNKNVDGIFQSRRSAFEQKSTTKRLQEPVKFELGSAKDTITFASRSTKKPNSFQMRKAKSTFDIRGAPPLEDRFNEGVSNPSGGEPELAQEYMKLQDDFMKWQQQLLQNQHVLHSRVAPIASNPPTLNNFGVAKDMGPPVNQVSTQPRKPIEITIPIRFEDTGEIVGPSYESVSRGDQEVQKPAQQFQSNSARPAFSQFSSSPWNTGPSVQVGSWDQRPSQQREKEPSPPIRQVNVFNSGSRPFNGPQYITPNTDMQTSFQSNPTELNDNQFRYQEAPDPQIRFQEASQPRYQNISQPKYQQETPRSKYQEVPQMRFQEVPQSRYQEPPQSRYQEPSQSRYQEAPQSRYQEAPQSRYQEAPQSRYQEAPQSRYQEAPQSRYQEAPQSRYQEAPQSRYQEAPQSRYQETSQSRLQEAPSARHQPVSQAIQQEVPKNVADLSAQYSYKPFNQSSASTPSYRPQMTYLNGPEQTNSNGLTADRNDDNINARFTSVVTLSNDTNGDKAPKKDKVKSIVQLNNVDNESLQNSTLFSGAPATKCYPIQGEPQTAVNEMEKKTPPIFSVTPMSSRLVQQAVQQPAVANSAGFRISPPRIERKSQSPPKLEQSPPPFAGVTLRHVETKSSPSRASPQRISPSRESAQTASTAQIIPPPPPPPVSSSNVPPPPPPPSSMIPPPPPLREGSEERRTSTGRRIMSANNVPQLDAREELMMAIRQFGGSGKLRRSPHPFGS